MIIYKFSSSKRRKELKTYYNGVVAMKSLLFQVQCKFGKKMLVRYSVHIAKPALQVVKDSP